MYLAPEAIELQVLLLSKWGSDARGRARRRGTEPAYAFLSSVLSFSFFFFHSLFHFLFFRNYLISRLEIYCQMLEILFLIFLHSMNIPCSVAGLDLRSNVLLRAVVFSQVFDGFFGVVVLVLVRPYLPPLFLGNFGGPIFREIAVCNHALRFQVVLLW